MDTDTASLTTGLPAWFGPWARWLDAATRREVARLRARYARTLDEFRGLYVSDDQVDRLLADVAAAPAEPPASAVAQEYATALAGVEESPLRRLAQEFALTGEELATVALALAPELDRRYETLFAYLNDDVTRQHATVDLCERVVGAALTSLDHDSALVGSGVLEVVPMGAAAAWRSSAVRVADPVRRFLLGVRPPAPPAHDGAPVPGGRLLGAALAEAPTTVVLVGPAEETSALAARLAAAAGRGLVAVADGPATDVPATLLTARLLGADVYLPLAEPTAARAAAAAPVHTWLGAPPGSRWTALMQGQEHDVVTLAPPDVATRQRLWREALHAGGARAGDAALADVSRLFVLHTGQIRRAAARAARATPPGASVDRAALGGAARAEAGGHLEELASRVPPAWGWDDLVLPPATLQRLRELTAAIRRRHEIFVDWGFGRSAGGSTSLRALFAGASGTGKTMSAAVIAGDLGVDLYRVDLSTVVSKYIGETEKNLDRVFAAAEGSNALLFFDEADAVFGKRSEVKDAHDRYANLETAYLLQRMEEYDGVLVLASNLPQNMDVAFARRIHVQVDFPVPDAALRERLWRLLLPEQAPLAADVDLAFLARQLPFTGGDIRNVTLEAAFLAAHEDSAIDMRALVRAAARARRRQGKLPSAGEFLHHLPTVRGEGR